MAQFDIVTATESAQVDEDDTITFAYPAGKTAADYSQAAGAVMVVHALQAVLDQGPTNFTLAYGATIVATWEHDTPIPAGSLVKLQIPLLAGEGLTMTVGTASNTLVDVTATPTQATVNNNFRSVGEKINDIIAALADRGIEI